MMINLFDQIILKYALILHLCNVLLIVVIALESIVNRKDGPLQNKRISGVNFGAVQESR